MLRTVLAGLSVLILLAVGYLTLSVVVLRPPRVDWRGWLTVASIVAVQIGLTLITLALAGAVPAALRRAVRAGAAVVAVLGGWMVRDTLTSAHFEGYALVLGATLVLDGVLTIAVVRPPLVSTVRRSTSPVAPPAS